ncbi:hypothetical protein D9M73_192750 [compost metagenome]
MQCVVAGELNVAGVEGADWPVLEKMLEVIDFFVGREPRCFRDRGQQDRIVGIQRRHLVGVAGLERVIPSLEQCNHVFLFDTLAIGWRNFSLSGPDAEGSQGTQ